MNASRTSDKIIWWRMGLVAAKRHGLEKAKEMAQDIKYDGDRNLFLMGVEGKPRPKVRRAS